MKEHVTSLELSRKLEKLGCKQVSKFYWVNEPKLDGEPSQDFHCIIRENFPSTSVLSCSAFLASELGEMLPWTVKAGGWCFELELWKDGSKKPWSVFYKKIETNENVNLHSQEFSAKTEADARALMLIYLLEHGLMEVGR